MDEGRRNLLVGLFVLLGIAAFGTLIVLFGRAPTWLASGSTYPLHVRFSEVAGIREGNLVTVKGMEIGRVDAVDLHVGDATPPTAEGAAVLVAQESGVNVVLGIKKRYLIPKGSTAIATEPMLGSGRPPVEIIPGPSGGEPLPPGATIEGRVRQALDSVFPPGVVSTLETTTRQIGDAAEALTPVLDELKGLLESRSPGKVDQPGGPQGNISSAIARMDAALKHFNEVIGDPQVKSQLRDTVANAHEMSEKGKKVMGDLELAATDAREFVTDARKLVTNAGDTVANVDQRIADLSRSMVETLDRADSFLDSMNAISAQIASGQGNLGQLVMDNKLYEAMTVTAERLSQAVEEFRGLVAEWREGKVRVGL